MEAPQQQSLWSSQHFPLNFSYPPLRQNAGILYSWSSFQGNNLFDELPMAQYFEHSIYYTSNIKLVQLFLMFKVFFMKKT